MNLFTINSNISWKLLKDAVVAVNLDDGNYYTFNLTASMIWQYIDEKKSVQEIEQLISEEFPDMEMLQIKEDIKEIMDFWLSEKLIMKNQ
jgi:hypothetical protein